MELRRRLEAHGAYLSEQDEVAIYERLGAGADVADLALRTCMCGVVIDGFDAYHAHLAQVLGHEAESTR